MQTNSGRFKDGSVPWNRGKTFAEGHKMFPCKLLNTHDMLCEFCYAYCENPEVRYYMCRVLRHFMET